MLNVRTIQLHKAPYRSNPCPFAQQHIGFPCGFLNIYRDWVAYLGRRKNEPTIISSLPSLKVKYLGRAVG